MKKVELYIVPYAKENEVKTRLVVDGSRINSKANRLTDLVVYQPMPKWLNPYKKKLFVWDGLLAEMIEEFNDNSFHFLFSGCKADFTVFKRCILLQQAKLNRNGGAVDVAFGFTDTCSPRGTIKEMIDILDNLRIEADKWGEDAIMKEINSVRGTICSCGIAMKADCLASSAAFESLLQNHNISLREDSALTVIPVDESASAANIRQFLSSLPEKNEAGRKYLVINLSARESEALFDAVVSRNGTGDPNMKYLETDGENYIPEIIKMYYLAAFPAAKQKAEEILHMFPDHGTNNFLIDISGRIDDLFRVSHQ